MLDFDASSAWAVGGSGARGWIRAAGRDLALDVEIFDQFGSEFPAASAAEAEAGLERNLVERIRAEGNGLAQLALGNGITHADVHIGEYDLQTRIIIIQRRRSVKSHASSGSGSKR